MTGSPRPSGNRLSGKRPSDTGLSGTGLSGTAGTSALLQSLLNDTLDPGYAAAARRRSAAADPTGGTGAGQGRAGDSRLMLGLGAFLVGLLLAVAYLHANRTAPADARTRADLRARIAAAQSEAAVLGRTVSGLQASADTRRAALLGNSSDDLSTAELQAGTTAVRGPGLLVTIDNPSVARTTAPANRPGSTPIGAVSVLTDTDVRAIVNQLWTDGAEALAVNNIRLTSTSAIRFAGEVVLVDFQPITAPYTISAIGNPDTLITDFTGSPVADRFRTVSAAYGFAFATTQEKDVTLPASALADPRYARAVTTSPAGPQSTGTTGPSTTPSAGPTS